MYLSFTDVGFSNTLHYQSLQKNTKCFKYSRRRIIRARRIISTLDFARTFEGLKSTYRPNSFFKHKLRAILHTKIEKNFEKC